MFVADQQPHLLIHRGWRGAADAKSPETTDIAGIRSSHHFCATQIKALIAAAECCNFSKAAAKIELSRPALSRCIKELELALGCDLFVRTKQGVNLTKAGKDVLAQAHRLLEAYEDMLSFLAMQRASRHHCVQLAADACTAPIILESLRCRLLSTSGCATLQLTSVGSRDPLNQVLRHEVEFCLCGEVDGLQRVRCTPVLESPLGLIVPKGCHAPEHIVSLESLMHVPIVRLAEHTPVTQTLRRMSVNFSGYFDSPTMYNCLSAAFDSMRGH